MYKQCLLNESIKNTKGDTIMGLSGINSNNSGVQNSTGGEKSTSEKTDAQKASEQILEYFVKYDRNKDRKISRKERKAAGLTKKQAREINKSLKGLIIEDAGWGDSKDVYIKQDKNRVKIGDTTHFSDGESIRTYDSDGNTTGLIYTYDDGYTESFHAEYNNEGKLSKITSQVGNEVTETEYDTDKRIIYNVEKTDDVVTLEERFQYDEKGNKLPVFKDDGKGNTTENKYYPNGNLAAQSQTFPDGSKKEVKFDQDGNLISYVLKNADGETLEQPNKGMTAEKKEIRNEKFKGLENYNFALNGAHTDIGMMTVNGENVLIGYWNGKYTLLRSSASGIGKVHTLDELEFSSMDEVKAALADKSYYWGSYNQGEVNMGDFVIP